MTKPTVFISYSHKDEVEKNQLITQLSVLQQSGVGLDLWVDDRIEAGGDWAKQIDEAMERASAAVLLVTANFLTSKFITETEVPRLLQRHKTGGLAIIPVIAKSCAWQSVDWLAKINVKPKNGTPVWRGQGQYADEELAVIALELAAILKEKAQIPAKAEAYEMSQPTKGELIYIDNFGKSSAELPPGAYHLDWTAHFDSRARPRRVPSPETWARELLPDLRDLERRISVPNLIRLRGSASLPTGFAVGQTFLEVGRFQLEVEQFSEGIVQPWYSTARKEPLGFIERAILGSAEAKDAVVIAYAAPRQNIDEIIQAVGHLFGEAELASGSRNFKQVLVLEAQPVTQEKRELTNWEAVTLAKTSAAQVRRMVGQVRPKTVHLFLAGPLGLAVFMGHFWNVLNCAVQSYEWVGGSKPYAPACRLEI